MVGLAQVIKIKGDGSEEKRQLKNGVKEQSLSAGEDGSMTEDTDLADNQKIERLSLLSKLNLLGLILLCKIVLKLYLEKNLEKAIEELNQAIAEL